MYTLKDHNDNIVKIASNESEMVNSLFTPGGTCSGYIQKTYKHQINFKMHGKEYVINKFGVILRKTMLNGKAWYQCTTLDYRACIDFVDSLTIKKDYFSSNDVIHFFK